MFIVLLFTLKNVLPQNILLLLLYSYITPNHFHFYISGLERKHWFVLLLNWYCICAAINRDDEEVRWQHRYFHHQLQKKKMDSDHDSMLLLSIPYPISVHGARTTFSTLPFPNLAVLPHNIGPLSEERRQRWMSLWHYTGQQLQLQSAHHGHLQV